MRWEYRPGSELFIVYNEERDSEAALGIPGLLNRAFIVKVNRFLKIQGIESRSLTAGVFDLGQSDDHAARS